jgi:hypothetical protein
MFCILIVVREKKSLESHACITQLGREKMPVQFGTNSHFYGLRRWGKCRGNAWDNLRKEHALSLLPAEVNRM